MALGPYTKNILAGISGQLLRTQQSATNDQYEQAQDDWRVRLTLASGTEHLFNDQLLAPLKDANGVIFPYTPQISIGYNANYEATDLTHSNYKIFQYKNSAVEQVSITATFTAQDTFEANYMLAAIHFFKTVTKMFYGQSSGPVPNGTPPPLCFLTGLGDYQFNEHPLVISSFTYTLPDKVDYIRATPTLTNSASSSSGKDAENAPFSFQRFMSGALRLGVQILAGGRAPATVFTPPKPGKFADATYVPTEMQIQITAYPVVSRNAISNEFSLEKYAAGTLTKKGIW